MISLRVAVTAIRPGFVRSLFCCLIFAILLPAATGTDNQTPAPIAKKGGVKWRIGYYEGGNFEDYSTSIHALIKGLASIGWIRNRPLAEHAPRLSSVQLWQWYSSRIDSDFIELVPDAVWSAEWSEATRSRLKVGILDRLNQRKDIDCMVAMGTWAGTDLASDAHSTFTMVLSTSDPLQSGIIKSPTESGFPHVFAGNDPDRFEKQLLLFHDTFQFKRLGVVFQDTKPGRSYAAWETVQRIARERDFKVITETCIFDHPDENVVFRNTLKAYQAIAPKIDAMYITKGGIHTPERIRQLAEPFLAARVPTLTQYGPPDVENGFLISMQGREFEKTGLFNAKVIARVFRGQKPSEIPQVFHLPPELSINMAVAHRIGWNVPLNLLNMVDQVFVELPPLPKRGL